MMENHYPNLLTFYYVANFMSFTKAAAYLNCSKAHTSKQISDLEQHIGSPLFYRNTRTITLKLDLIA